jgi:hypothetical protein
LAEGPHFGKAISKFGGLHIIGRLWMMENAAKVAVIVTRIACYA